MAEQEATQQRLEEARAALQLAEAELEVERAEGRRVAQELAEAQSRLLGPCRGPGKGWWQGPDTNGFLCVFQLGRLCCFFVCLLSNMHEKEQSACV